MWVKRRRSHGLRIVLALLLGLSLVLALLEGPGPARALEGAAEREQDQEAVEKEQDLERARRNGGISPNRLIVVSARAVPLDQPDRVRTHHSDPSDHGTRVAGTIAAAVNNGIGAVRMATGAPTPGAPPSTEQEAQQSAVSAICPRRFRVNASGGAMTVAYCTDAGRSLDARDDAIRRAVVVIHGSSRNADDYHRYVQDSAAAVGAASSSIVVAPQYLDEDDINAFKTPADPLIDLLYWDGGWREGENSRDSAQNDRPAKISSFAVADQIIGRFADRGYFPNLQTIVVTGHSAGGQFTNRFAAASGAEPAGIARRYVPMNPSSWLYFTRERRVNNTLDEFAIPSATQQQQCSEFNNYKYGLDKLTPYPYVAAVGPDQLKARYASRSVAYLLGQLDNANTDSLDIGCEAGLQGDYRLDRGNRYYNFVGHVFGSAVYSRHVKEIVPGVAHEGNAMINSAAGRRYLFDVGAAPAPTATPTATAPPTSPTATATATRPAATSGLAAPTNLVAAGISSTQINLSWTESAPDEDGYDIERCSGNGCSGFSRIGSVGRNATSYSNTRLSSGTSYTYRLRAFKGCGDDCTQYGSYSGTATATAQSGSPTPTPTRTPTQPPGPTATPTAGPPSSGTPVAPVILALQRISTSQINLTWQHDSVNTTQFRIERCKGSGCNNFSLVTNVAAGTTSYQNPGLSKNSAYTYRVRAEKGSAVSGYSNLASAWTTTDGNPPPPPPPE